MRTAGAPKVPELPMQHTSILALITSPNALEGAAEAGLGGTQGPDLTRYFTVCALLLLGILALAWGFRRLVGRSLTKRAAMRSMQIMDVLPMGGKRRLAVVRCYDRTFLVGLGERELSLVAELDPVIAPESQPAGLEADRRGFADLLRRAPEGVPGPRSTPRPEPRTLSPEGVLG